MTFGTHLVCRTSPLTSRCCILYIIQQIYIQNILNMLHTPFFSSSKCRLFHNATFFGSRVIHILYTGCAKIKKNSVAKGLRRFSNSAIRSTIGTLSVLWPTSAGTFPVNSALCHVQVWCFLWIRVYIAGSMWIENSSAEQSSGSDIVILFKAA